MSTITSSTSQSINLREKSLSISSNDSHLVDEDEKFYDAFDDTVCLLNNLHLNNNNKDLLECNNNEEDDEELNDENYVETSENDLTKEKIIDEDEAELETAWTFWFDRCIRGTSMNDYEAGLKLIYKVETAQSFWRVFNNIPDVSNLPSRCSYHLMRGSRRPLWEDADNSQGGQWNLKCRKEDTSTVWREALLAAIGEQFSDNLAKGDEIVGISVSCRDKDDIIQIWNLNYALEPNATVCQKLEQLVPDVKFTVKFYKPNTLHEAFGGNSSAATKKSK